MNNSQEMMQEKIYKYTSIQIKDSCDFEISECGIGGRIWKSAVILACFLKNKLFDNYAMIDGKVVLEIGAGTGVSGIVAASMNAKKVYLTDRDEGCLKLLEKNVEFNKSNSELTFASEIEIVKLDWICPSDFLNIKDDVDVILASDVLYCLAMVDTVISVLEKLCNQSTIAILSNPSRGEEYEVFVDKLNKSGQWSIDIVPDEILEEKFYKHFVVVLKKQ